MALIGVGPRLGLERPEAWAVCVLGLGFFLFGLDGVVTGESTSGLGRTRIRHYGMSARLRSAAFAFIGLAVAVVSFADAVGLATTTEVLSGTRGLGLTLMSLGVLGSFGGGILLAERARKSLWLAVPGRLLGALLLLVSLAAAAAGLVTALQPQTVEAWAAKLRSPATIR